MHEAPNSLSRLVDTHGRRLYATLVRLTLSKEVGGELFQELFVRLARQPGFAAARDPAAYAFRAAINLAMEWRRKRRGGAVPLALTEEIVADDLSPPQRAVVREEHERLLNAVSELSETPRRVFVMRCIEQQSYDEVARQLQTTPHRARAICHVAIKELRGKLSGLRVR